MHDRDAMVSGMAPLLRPGQYVFVTAPVAVPAAAPAGPDPLMTFRETEGVTWVLTRQEADGAGLDYDLVLAWITLSVHSALDGVGLTAAVSAALADAGIACNMVAARFHDHLFVPIDRAEEAVRRLTELAAYQKESRAASSE